MSPAALPLSMSIRLASALTLLCALAVNADTREEAGDSRTRELSHLCPPSFELLADHTCALRTIYQLYSAPENHGGLRVPLPVHRDGFTPEQIDLGRYLFFDPILSDDRTMACASCHDPRRAFTDGRAKSVGHRMRTEGERIVLSRSAPTLWNVGFQTRFFWDGRASSLEEQAVGPLFSADEMASTPANLTATLHANAAYRRLFAAAFGRAASEPIAVGEVVKALAAFESSLVSVNSRYDRYSHGDQDALTPLEIAGLNIFRGFVARCSQCHTPPLFTNDEIAVVGAPASADGLIDPGAGAQAGPMLLGGFKVPTLRNIAKTAPYFSGGQFPSLRKVIEFYNGGPGHALPSGVPETIHWHIAMKAGELAPREIDSLVAFLESLSDESLLPEVPLKVPSGLPVGMQAAKRIKAACQLARYCDT